MQDREELILNPDETPDTVKLSELFKSTRNDLDGWVKQQEENYKTRFNVWAGQNKDQRKHGTQALPWDGASDLKTYIIDQIITSDVATLKQSLKKSSIVASPVESGDIKQAGLVSMFMKWLIFSQMDELNKEAEILANYYLEKGIGVVGVFWESRVTATLRKITVEEIAEAAGQDQDLVSQMITASDEELVTIMATFFPKLKKSKLKRMVKELREDGETTFPSEEVTVNRPRIKAYTIDENFVIPLNTVGLQESPYFFITDPYTPEALREKVLTEGWDEKLVDKAIETQMSKDNTANRSAFNSPRRRPEGNINLSDGYVTLVTAFQRAVDKDGMPAIYMTVFHPDIKGHISHTMLDYRPSRYPFVEFPRENLSRRLLDTRGYPEIGKGWQDEVKIQRDCRIDRAALSTCPPREYPIGRPAINWGPGSNLPVRRRGEYGFAEIPQFDQGSNEVEANIMVSMFRYFGRPTSELDAQFALITRQNMVSNWLSGWKEVFRQVWSLYRQYGSEVEYFRVLGSNEANLTEFKKAEVSEKYDFYLEFDVDTLDKDKYLEKLKAIGEVMSTYDRSGSGKTDDFMRLFITAIDPILADSLIEPKEVATEKEMAETQADLAKISAGISVNPPQNANVQLRIQEIQKFVQGTEELPATDVQERLQENESFRGRLENYQKQLMFQEQQRENAITGKIGAVPGNGLPTSQNG